MTRRRYLAARDVARREACAGGIVLGPDGRLLLVRRAHEPGAGLWSVPGGRCRPGELAADACVREVAEETGLAVRVVRHVGRVERAGAVGTVYDIDDFVCTPTGGTLCAGDDAAEVRWATRADLAALDVVPGLVEALAAWDCLPE